MLIFKKTHILIAYLLIFSCSNGTSPSETLTPKKIFDKSVNRIKIEYPYLYVAAWVDGLWRIRIDDGSNLVEKLELPDSVDGISKIADVTIFGNDIIVSTWNSIYQSRDSGLNWLQRTEGIPYIQNINSIERFNSIPENIITHNVNSIYWSDNNAQNWNDSNLNLPHESSNTFIKISPIENGVSWIYGMTNLSYPVLYCTSEYGKKLKLEVNLTELFGLNYHLISFRDFVFDNENSEILYFAASTHPPLYKSKNGGLNWEPILSDSIQVQTFSQAISKPNFFYASDLWNIYTSDDTLHTFDLVCSLGEPETEENIIHQIIFENISKKLFIATYTGIYSLSLN